LRGSTGVEDETGVGVNSLPVSARGKEAAIARKMNRETEESTWFRRALRQEVPKIGRVARNRKPTRGTRGKGNRARIRRKEARKRIRNERKPGGEQAAVEWATDRSVEWVRERGTECRKDGESVG
jgi:hypothetical protein